MLRLVALVAVWLIATASAHAQSRPLVVGSSATYPPFAYETPTKQIVGFDVDVIQAVAQKAGLALRIVNTPFTGIFASLDNGDLDLVISGVTITDRRRQSYDFSAPYFEARQLIAVPASSPVKALADLTGRKVGVVTGSTADDVASRTFGRTSPNIRRFDTTPLIVAELVAGGVDAAIGDNGVIAAVILRKSGDDAVVDTWIMSCRVLGRRIEDLTVQLIAERARHLGCRRVVGRYTPTAKNRIVEALYPQHGFEAAGSEATTRLYALDLDQFEPKSLPIVIINQSQLSHERL